jgi:hypothetical protein
MSSDRYIRWRLAFNLGIILLVTTTRCQNPTTERFSQSQEWPTVESFPRCLILEEASPVIALRELGPVT